LSCLLTSISINNYYKTSKKKFKARRSTIFLDQMKQLLIVCDWVWGKMKKNSENIYLEIFVK